MAHIGDGVFGHTKSMHYCISIVFIDFQNNIVTIIFNLKNTSVQQLVYLRKSVKKFCLKMETIDHYNSCFIF